VRQDEGGTVAGDEPVTSPDQHRPMISRRLAYAGALLSALAMLAMLIGNHEGNVENIFLIATAAGLVLTVVVDAVLRRNGLRSED
jgi:hypothetical protein